MIKKSILSIILLFSFVALTMAQQSILLIDSSTKKVSQLNATDGSVINANFIDLSPLVPGTLKGLTQVDNKIWISDQTKDAIYIYTLSGTYESTISAGLDNIRGLNVVNNEVWVSNAGSSNGAPANSVVRFSKSGANLGSYTTITSPFDVLDLGNGSALVTSFSTAGIQKISYNGITTSDFVGSGIISNAEQINFNNSGNILCSVFSSSGTNPAGIYEFSPAGIKLNNWPITTGSLRGVIATTGTNYLVSTSSGLYSLDPVTGVSTLVVSGNYQFFAKIDAALGVDEIKTFTSVKFYPNPVQEVLNIISPQIISAVTISSASGQNVYSRKTNSKEIKIDVYSLPTGIYFVKILNKNLKAETFKIIKK